MNNVIEGNNTSKINKNSISSVADSGKQLRVCIWNIRGMTKEKSDDRMLGSLFQGMDMVILLETWFRENLEVELNNFTSIHFNRAGVKKGSKRGSGGIFCVS